MPGCPRARACAGVRPARASTRSRRSNGPRAAPRSRCTCEKARTVSSTVCGCAPCCAAIPTTSCCRCAWPRSAGTPSSRATCANPRRRRSTRPPPCGLARATRSPTSSTPSSIATCRTITRPRSRGAMRRSRGGRSTPSCSTCPRVRPSTCGIASGDTGSSCTCAGCSSWTTPSSCCLPTCDSSAAWSTRTTCRSTCRAKSSRKAATSRPSAPAA